MKMLDIVEQKNIIEAIEQKKIVKMRTGLQVDSPYYYGRRIQEYLPELLSSLKYDKIFVISNPTIQDLHGNGVSKTLRYADIKHEVIILPDGEKHKSFNQLSSLCETLIKKNISKSSILIAFGGGVIGNIVGLAAALTFRGVRFIEMPTTTMSQTDSTLSNKQAINGERGKNLFGVYYAPILIWSDSHYSFSEHANHTKGSLVEAVKNGFINSPPFLNYLDNSLKIDGKYTEEEFHNIIGAVIESKLQIIRRDPTEKAFGMVLEYGHTFGHALEWLCSSLSHGEAVAIGMCYAAELSYELKLCTDETRRLHYQFLREKNGNEIYIPSNVGAKDIINTMRIDNKKTTGNDIAFVLLKEPGVVNNPDGSYLTKVDFDVIRRITNRFVGEYRAM